jgi:predicted Zn-dependent peptidase
MNPKAILLSLAILVAAPLLAASPAGAQAAAVVLPRPETYTLPNGLRVVLDEDHRAPFVGVSLALRAGRRDDPQGRSGLADLLGNLFRDASTRHVDRSHQEALFHALGVAPFWPEVRSLIDETTLALTVPSRDLGLALWLEGDRLGFFADGVNDDSIAAARQPLLDEVKRGQGDPYAALVPTTLEAIFGPEHPYGHAFSHTAAELGAVTPAELRAQIRRLYVPGNAALALSGDLDPAAARELVATYFGTLGGAAPAAALDPPRPPLPGEKRLRMEARIAQPSVLVTWPTARFLTEADLTLDLVSLVLKPRLERSLVQEAKIAGHVNAWQQSLRLGSAFVIEVRLADKHQPEEALGVIDRELARMRDAPVTAAELARAEEEMRLRSLRVQDRLEKRAFSLADLALHPGDPRYMEKMIAVRRAVDGERLRAIVRAELPPDRRLITVVTPEPSAPPGGRLVAGGPTR